MDSSELNIPSTVKDPHYRYTMPRIQVVSQGSGNGIKTKWINLAEVSNALKVPIEYPLKFIGHELGSITEIKANIYLINGNHTSENMQTILDKFINKYVLCPKCKLPEIHGKVSVKKGGDIRCLCRSCGALSKLDSGHAFASYIKRSPPPYDEDTTEGGSGVSNKKEAKKGGLDSKMTQKIKACCKSLPKLLKNDGEAQENISIIQKALDENHFPVDIKYFVLANCLMVDKVYTEVFVKRLPLIKHFVTQDNDKKEDEAVYFFLVGLCDFLFNRQKGVNAKYLPSVLYYLYQEDIIKEDFWVSYAVKKGLKYNTILYNPETEKKFLNAANEFTKWIENGPYEGEEGNMEEHKENANEEINIDDI